MLAGRRDRERRRRAQAGARRGVVPAVRCCDAGGCDAPTCRAVAACVPLPPLETRDSWAWVVRCAAKCTAMHAEVNFSKRWLVVCGRGQASRPHQSSGARADFSPS